MQIGDNNSLDPNGAGDYLPDADLGDANSESNGSELPAEKVSVAESVVTNVQEAGTYNNKQL